MDFSFVLHAWDWDSCPVSLIFFVFRIRNYCICGYKELFWNFQSVQLGLCKKKKRHLVKFRERSVFRLTLGFTRDKNSDNWRITRENVLFRVKNKWASSQGLSQAGADVLDSTQARQSELGALMKINSMWCGIIKRRYQCAIVLMLTL